MTRKDQNMTCSRCKRMRRRSRVKRKLRFNSIRARDAAIRQLRLIGNELNLKLKRKETRP